MKKIQLNSNLSDLAKMSKSELLSRIGVEDFRKVLINVFQGENIRSFTEILTRNRLLKCNKELWDFFIFNKKNGVGPLDMIPIVKKMLLEPVGINVKEKAVLEWLLSITDKQNQNVLRRNQGEEFDLLTKETIDTLNKLFNTDIRYSYSTDNCSIKFTSEEVIWISMVIGSMTLTIRGSEKSLHGKYFEKLILGSLFQMFGLKMVEVEEVSGCCFWLSSQRDNRRESDATIVSNGKGIRVDIGFIGPGNSEVTLDKVSRYQKEDEISGRKYNMSTLIIVDNIGSKSNAKENAMNIGGEIICMSDPDWVFQVFRYISKNTNIKNPLEFYKNDQLEAFLENEIVKIDLSKLID